ncbi:small hydrophobic protein [Streptomyces buecherae]|uniref:Small hydrophobic protein n=2 Tax=Streptomyces buecherae TaxID=2763006 RepID=A0A7H8NJY3_9ACTN|nr:small hydrophobic protein [Streptomyces buecherae]
MNEEDRAPWGLTIRVTFYLVGVHIFAAFLFLLFHLGAK